MKIMNYFSVAVAVVIKNSVLVVCMALLMNAVTHGDEGSPPPASVVFLTYDSRGNLAGQYKSTGEQIMWTWRGPFGVVKKRVGPKSKEYPNGEPWTNKKLFSLAKKGVYLRSGFLGGLNMYGANDTILNGRLWGASEKRFLTGKPGTSANKYDLPSPLD